mgnify:FL=1
MSRTPPSKGKLLYHITHLNNMPSILQHGLLSRKALQEAGIFDFTDIADPSILSKRELYREALSKFVLFHFYAKNPFDGAVCKKYGSENMVIITIRRELHKIHEFLIIPSHPLDCDEPEIYSYEEGFAHIRWDILDRETGRDYHDPEIRKACMAECVMGYEIPVDLFSFVYVNNDQAKQKIEALPNGHKVTVKVAPYMFP